MTPLDRDPETYAEVRDHSFDGIQEYDNQLPRWWVYKFVITIIFAAGYLYWFHFAQIGKNLQDSYDFEKTELAEKLRLSKPPEAPVSKEELKALAQDPQSIEKGKAVFATRCASCHGMEGEGVVGPNLTDKYWIHGGALTAIVKTIEEGVPAKGMVPWKSLLSRDEIHQVAVFVKSLEGKKVSNPKKPEGELSSEE